MIESEGVGRLRQHRSGRPALERRPVASPAGRCCVSAAARRCPAPMTSWSDTALVAAAAHPLGAAAASLCSFCLLNQCLRTALEPRAEQLFGRPGNPGRAIEQLGVFANHATTMVHVVITAVCVIDMLRHEDGLELLHADPLHGELRLMLFLYPFSFGYVLYDTVDLFRTYRSKARSSPPHWCACWLDARLAAGSHLYSALLAAAASAPAPRSSKRWAAGIAALTPRVQDASAPPGVARWRAVLVRGRQRSRGGARVHCGSLRSAAPDHAALHERVQLTVHAQPRIYLIETHPTIFDVKLREIHEPTLPLIGARSVLARDELTWDTMAPAGCR